MTVALAQRVVGADAEAVHQTTLHAQKEAVVLLLTQSRVLVGRTQIVAIRVIGHRNFAALIEVCIDRAYREELRTGRRLQRAGARNVDTLVERAHVPEPVRERPDVCRRQGHVIPELTLDTQIPRLLPWRLD